MENYVCVIGGANVDIAGKAFEKLNANDSNPGVVTTSLGGVGRNIAENLSRMGINIEFISILGGDNYSRDIQESCKSLNMSLKYSLLLEDKRTSIYLSIIDEDGEMAVAISDMGIYDMITPEFLKDRLEVINNSSACICDTNIPKESLEYIMNNVNAPIFIDTVSIHKTEKLKDNLNNVFALKPNILEAQILSGIKIESDEDLDKATDLIIHKGVKQLYLSLGPKGVYYTDGINRGKLPSITKDIVNVTGAGDSFLAGVIWAHTKGFDIESSAKAGLAASNITLLSQDTVSKEISEENLLRIIENNWR
ncbi:kinase [Tissierella creatinini]|nr:kinase [Tissierella creatinini]TJX59533.1 kinase [Soehngenia saccharolytica]